MDRKIIRKRKKLGSGIVLFSLSLMIVMLFTNQYRLTKHDLDKTDLSDEQMTALVNADKGFLGKTLTGKFAFLSRLNDAFVEANLDIVSKYKIDPEVAGKAVKLSRVGDKVKFLTGFADSIFSQQDEAGRYRIRQFKSYTGWIEDKTYDNPEKLHEDLQVAISKINENIVSTRGINRHEINQLRYRLLKDGSTGWVPENALLLFFLTFVLGSLGSLFYVLQTRHETTSGINNDGIYFNKWNNRGLYGIMLGVFLILFYVLLYWFPEYIVEWTILLDPISQSITGRPASQWFLYGFIYTLAILIMGVKFLIKYRHSRHHRIRTYSVMFFQLIFAFTIPQILYALSLPEMDLKNIWPLNYYFFYEWQLNEFLSSGTAGMLMLIWGIALIIPGVPLLTYFLGKRWYCSWVCGCSGLAETAGDPFRHLSDKGLRAWRIERWLVHSVLVFAVFMTAGVLYSFFTGKSQFLGLNTYDIRSVYGFLIGAVFAGVIGVGFYPYMGSRVWCRFGCPLAAYLGIVQRFKSRFRITTNGGQCISCGNCSTYCEMGIDVRWYAQRGQNIIRASCVGCGVCAAVCPRGVLRLENKKEKGRFNLPAYKNRGFVLNRKGVKSNKSKKLKD